MNQYPVDHYNAARPSEDRPAGRWGNYRFDHCQTLNDLLPPDGDYSGLNTKTGNTARIYNCRNKHQLAKRIAWDFLAAVLDHVIDTGDHYLLPAGDNSLLRVVAMPPTAAEMLIRQKRYRMNDPWATQGRFYQLRLELGRYGRRRVKGVYVDMGRYHRLCRLIATQQVAYDLS